MFRARTLIDAEISIILDDGVKIASPLHSRLRSPEVSLVIIWPCAFVDTKIPVFRLQNGVERPRGESRHRAPQELIVRIIRTRAFVDTEISVYLLHVGEEF